MTGNVFERLRAPFPPDRISWRVGSTTADKKKGLAFGYIDARDVMERLDDVCGPENWQCAYPHAGAKTVCAISIRVTRDGGASEWVSKSDGAGDTDVESEKGALSDSFKRCAVRFGIGRYLYDIPATWVEIEPAGKSFKIAAKEFARLEGVLRRGASTNSINAAPLHDEPSARDKFISATSDIIRTSTDAAALRQWWSADDQKKQRRDFELSQVEVAGLLALMKTKIDSLGMKAA